MYFFFYEWWYNKIIISWIIHQINYENCNYLSINLYLIFTKFILNNLYLKINDLILKQKYKIIEMYKNIKFIWKFYIDIKK